MMLQSEDNSKIIGRDVKPNHAPIAANNLKSPFPIVFFLMIRPKDTAIANKNKYPRRAPATELPKDVNPLNKLSVKPIRIKGIVIVSGSNRCLKSMNARAINESHKRHSAIVTIVIPYTASV
ncbi:MULTISPECIES: hypothetical protein [Cysteiniphilum]|uniref:hypothetical protein n=1 Tax=Cysteiniphilum sp. 19X3-34 TaxID=2775040 RepID=UPI001EF19AAB|nr:MULTISPECIES: hypothetical protein [Cysteiniphilum]